MMPIATREVEIFVNAEEVSLLVANEIRRYLEEDCGLTEEERGVCDGPLYVKLVERVTENHYGAEFHVKTRVPLDIYDKIGEFHSTIIPLFEGE